jgi:hypothetical protein
MLLTLPGLPPERRVKLERAAAAARASEVHDLHRLYPKVIQCEPINRPLVEAQPRRRCDCLIASAPRSRSASAAPVRPIRSRLGCAPFRGEPRP